MNILIVKLSAIGDVIHTLPALNTIRNHYPDAHITWLVEEDAAIIIDGHKALDRVLISRRKRWTKGLASRWWLKHVRDAFRFIRELRDTRYDLVINFQPLLKSGILVGLSRGIRKVGFDRGMDHMEHSYMFLNERVPAVNMDHHALLRSLMLLESIGMATNNIAYHFPIATQDRETLDALLKRHAVNGHQRIVAINPVAKWETKRWRNVNFAKLADQLITHYGVQVVFTGSRDDRGTIDGILNSMQCQAVNLAGRTSLKTLAALFEKIAFLVSTDTGPMHMAAAVGTPVVALFGPTAPWRTGPFGSGHQVIRVGLPCSPCFKRQCETVECMDRIRVRDVLEGVQKLGIV
jgi:lipopolysaccharide heptosyltransferase I